MSDSTKTDPMPPEETTAALVLGDGTVFWARGVGAVGQAVGEVCFNTSLTGYQEIMTDPSYAGQIITFTFPHIGNVGTNDEDIETITPSARGCVLRADITEPANWRAVRHYDDWLKSHNLVGIAGVDKRRLTRRIRDLGAPHATICHAPDGKFDIAALQQVASSWPGLEGMDLAKDVSCRQSYTWDETAWALGEGYGRQTDPSRSISERSGTYCAISPISAVRSRWFRRTPRLKTCLVISRTACSSPMAPAIRRRRGNTRCR